MNEAKKTVLFLMNGFGMEAPKSFNVYQPSLMPNLDRISHAYPFTTMATSDTEAGLNKRQIGNFKSNYLSFSTEGKILKKEDILESKIDTLEIMNDKNITEAINYSLNHGSRFHILFVMGNKYSENVYKQLKSFCDVCINKGIKEIYLHLFVGDNTNPNQKTATNCIKSLKFHVIGANQMIKIATVANKRMLTDETTEEEKRNYYRMIVSGVGEIWTDYADVIERTYKKNLTDDSINPFLVRRENVIKDNDSMFFFNYDNNLGEKYLDIIANPSKYFTSGKLPLNIRVGALFEINDSKITYSYENELPSSYFLENIPEDRKILVLASKERIGYVVNSLNGFRKEYKSSLNVLPIDISTGDRFNTITKYLLAYQEQNIYDLIIVDYELINSNDKKDIPTLKRNMNILDNCLGAVYNKSQEKNQDLIVTSLYGELGRLNLVEREMVQINFSDKTPLIVSGKGIERETYEFKHACSITNLPNILYNQLGIQTKTQVFGLKGQKKKNNKLSSMVLIAVLVAVVLYVVYLYLLNR